MGFGCFSCYTSLVLNCQRLYLYKRNTRMGGNASSRNLTSPIYLISALGLFICFCQITAQWRLHSAQGSAALSVTLSFYCTLHPSSKNFEVKALTWEALTSAVRLENAAARQLLASRHDTLGPLVEETFCWRCITPLA